MCESGSCNTLQLLLSFLTVSQETRLKVVVPTTFSGYAAYRQSRYTAEYCQDVRVAQAC